MIEILRQKEAILDQQLLELEIHIDRKRAIQYDQVCGYF